MARTDLEQLVYTMDADIRKLTKAMEKANGVVDRKSRQIEDRLERQSVNVGKALKNVFDDSRLRIIESGAARLNVFGSALEPLGPAGFVAAGGIAAMAVAMHEVRDALRFIDELSDTADRLHVTTDALQEYRYAIRAAGGEEKGADEALEAFGITLGRAQEGLAKAKKGFKALGFTDADIKSFHSVEEALIAVSARIAKLRDGHQRDTAAEQLGLGGLKQLLDDGPAGIARLRAEAQSAGVVFDSALIQRSKDLNDEFETLEKKIDHELKAAFVGAAPALLDLLKLVAKMATEAGRVVDAFNRIEAKRTANLKADKEAFEARQANPVGRAVLGWNDQPRLARINKELAKRAADAATPPSPPGGDGSLANVGPPPSGPTLAEKLQRGRDALNSAIREGLRAQMALTDNVEELARLKADEIDAELKKTVDRLKADIDQGKIDKALAEQAIAAETKAAADQKALVRREAEERVEDVYFDRQRRIGALIEEAWSAQAGIARTVQERLAVERRILVARQREERAELERQFDRQKAHGTYNASGADAERASLRDKQGAELEALQTNAVRDLASDFRDGLQTAFDALRGKVDVMDYLADRFTQRLLDGWAEMAAKAVLDGGSGGSGGNIVSAIASILGFGRRAGGGGVQAGRAYKTGETGEEWFVPGASGTIIPNRIIRNLGAGGARSLTVVQNIDAKGAFMAPDLIAYVDAQAGQAIKVATAQSVALATQVVPARMARQSRQRTR